MEYKKIVEDVVKKAIRAGADEADVYFEKKREFSLRVRNGEVETVKQSATNGMGLTVYKEKKSGFSHTSDFSLDSLDGFVKKTVELCLLGDPRPWYGLPDVEQGKPKDLDLWDPSVAKIEKEKKIKTAKKVEKLALSYDKKITKTGGASFSDSETEAILMNSKGISRSSKATGVSFGVSVIAGEGSHMQSGGWGSGKTHVADLETIEKVAEKAGKRAVEKLGARPVKTQKVPVVFDRRGAPAFWWGLIRALNGGAFHKKRTFFKDSLNKPVASELITLVDDPTIPRHTVSVPFDGEGRLTQRNVLIDKGVLKMFIYDSSTARRYGVKVNTITKRFGYKTGAYGSHINVIVQNGKTKKEEMLAGIKEGFLITRLRGLGTDMMTGNFSVGASGFWISNGEVVFPVDGVTLGGKTLDILKNIELVADDLEVRGGLNSPSFKVSELIVGGK